LKIVNSNDWINSRKIYGEAAARLILLDNDIASVQLSYLDYIDAQEKLSNNEEHDMDIHYLEITRIFHHAKNFVTSVRRVGRLVESMSANRIIYGVVAAPLLQIAWRKKKNIFDAYIEPRNAIEHIDSEINKQKKLSFTNMEKNIFKVTSNESHHVEITESTVDIVLSTRNEIVNIILQSNA